MNTKLAVILLFSTLSAAQTFNATPLTDLPSGLYENSNLMPSDHDTDGYNAGLAVQSLDTLGQPSPTGKIGFLSAGHSIPERLFCGDQVNGGVCYPGSMMDVMQNSPSINPAVVPINGAEEGASTFEWAYSSSNVFPRIKALLAAKGMTPAQVEVIWWDGVENQPQARGLLPMQPNAACLPVLNSSHPPVGTYDSCEFEQLGGVILRLFKKNYPNLKQVFIVAGAYAGYFTRPQGCVLNQYLCPDNEPFMYQVGFGKKQLIEDQILQLRDKAVSPISGNLDYATAAWVAWGPYLWAPACPTQRLDGVCYNRSDFTAGDGLHPSLTGIQKIVSQQLLPFFLSDPHTVSWFIKQ